MKFLLTWALALTTLSAQALTIGAYNIRNFDYDERYRITTNKPELAGIIKNLNVDVLSVEEIHDTAKWDEFVAKSLPGFDTEVTRCGGDHGQRLGFLYNKSTVEMLAFNEDLSVSNPGGPGTCDSGSRPMAIALFQVKATKQRFFGITLHLKSGNQGSSMMKRQKQYDIIKKTIQELKSKTGVQDFYFAGDLNTTEYGNKGADFTQLSRVVKDLGMVNLTDRVGCTAYWWGGTDDGVENPTTLDHVIATPGLIKGQPKPLVYGHCAKVQCRQARVQDLGVSYEGVSDHCPITATIQ
ncbi:endonuclease/exonuclease/phosphatase family protein [Peredibacter sp. HCB2-198]|uniref:endonuclease/exonuclease/phosphatase family protein n=1 Tax=Peredibacter sp. HCB2-198 TaxID=3383025 RepID=UPI0038B4E35D